LILFFPARHLSRLGGVAGRIGNFALAKLPGGVQRGAFPLWLNTDFAKVRIKLLALKKPMRADLFTLRVRVYNDDGNHYAPYTEHTQYTP